MDEKIGLYMYTGKSQVAFEKGRIYEAYADHDDVWEFYSVKDESGEWYCYGKEFFEANFVKREKNKYDGTLT